MKGHAEAAKKFNADEAYVNWHDQSLWHVRQKRDRAANRIKGWEQLRTLASGIKTNVMANLDDYLIEFEENALKNNIQVHWARNASEHNEIVYQIINKHQARKIVKSKSMLTEECHLNAFLEEKGIEIIDTDLGERIVQLAGETPSHIVMPAIHKKKEQIDELLHQHLGTKISGGDEVYLTREARKHLREKFLQADLAITGVNFGIAETGGFVVCTNEGNADMGVHLAPVHIACMGIEKLIPKRAHLGVFLRLLARSATGQAITTYSSHFQRPAPGKELHIVLVDNGRSVQLARPDFRRSLHCIRCGACMNTCPIYRRSGGHSYDATVPGPIGSILSPGTDLKKYSSLPFASTLCGSCSDVCPVKIDIHRQLFKWRQIIMKESGGPFIKRMAMKFTGWIFPRPKLFAFTTRLGNLFLKIFPRFVIYNRFNIWGRQRELPKAATNSFSEWYKKNRKHES